MTTAIWRIMGVPRYPREPLIETGPNATDTGTTGKVGSENCKNGA